MIEGESGEGLVTVQLTLAGIFDVREKGDHPMHAPRNLNYASLLCIVRLH